MKRLVLISYNQHKYHEYQRLLQDSSFKLEPLEVHFSGHLEETGNSFEANALQKLNQIKKQAHTYYIAEDSGLVIDALNGEPGVYSARYAGSGKPEHNIQKVLLKMENVSQRNAYFKAVIALYEPSGKITTFEGVCHGRIHTQSAGESGFGYDPIFIPIGYDQTFAQLGEDIKHRLSHRFAALQKFKHYMQEV
jgi:XTP/dITP diphosphohydrolase